MSWISQTEYMCLLKFAPILLILCALTAMAGAAHKGIVLHNGLPVPGATVTAIQEETRQTTVTNLQGEYFFTDLTDGSWSIQVEMTGFVSMSRALTPGPDRTRTEWEPIRRHFEFPTL